MLSNFIRKNFVDVHIFTSNGTEYSNLDWISDDIQSLDLSDWHIYANVYTHDLSELSHLLGHEYFNDGIQVIWKDGYVTIDLMDIINYFDLNVLKIL